MIVLLGGAVAPAAAQVIDTPPGSVGGFFGGHGPLDPNRTAQRWTVTAEVSGGRETEPVELGPGDPSASAVSGAAATGSLAMRYWRGRTGRFFEASGGGFINQQSAATEQLRGADAEVRAETSIGGRTSINGAVTAMYQPLILTNPLAPAGTIAETSTIPADVSPPRGILEQRWLSTLATAGITRNWTPRQSVAVDYSRWSWRPINGPGFETRSDTVSVREAWNVTERTSLQFGYNFEQNRQGSALDAIDPTTIHTADAGLRLQRRLSPDRTFTVLLRGGASYAASIASAGIETGSSLLPTGSAAFQFNLSRLWSMSGHAGRQVTVLDGVAPQPFTTDEVSLQLGGMLARRLSVGAFGAYSRGTTVDGQPGSFEAGSATAQLQLGLASWCGIFTSYSYYQHRLLDIETRPIGFPGSYGRHSARVGLTLWLPLYGTF